MKMLAQISVPAERGAEAIKSGALEKTIKECAERWHPEAMYFGPVDGRRTCWMVVDLPETSDLPAFSEPFFDVIGADVHVVPVMDQDDLSRGLGKLQHQ